MKKLLCLIIMASLLMTSGFASTLEETYPEQDWENDLAFTDVVKAEEEKFEASSIFKVTNPRIQAGATLKTSEVISEAVAVEFESIGRLELWGKGTCLIEQGLAVSSIPTAELEPGDYQLKVRYASKVREIPLKVAAKPSGGGGGAPFKPAPVVEEEPAFEELIEALSDGRASSWQAIWDFLSWEDETELEADEAEEMILQVLDQPEWQARLTEQGRARSHDARMQLSANVNQLAEGLAEKLHEDGSFDPENLDAFLSFWNQVEEKNNGIQIPVSFAARAEGGGVISAEEMKLLADQHLQFRMLTGRWSFVFDSSEWTTGGKVGIAEKDDADAVASFEIMVKSKDQQAFMAEYDLSQHEGGIKNMSVQRFNESTSEWEQVQAWLVANRMQFAIYEGGQYRLVEKMPQFADIEDHWAEEVILRMNARGFIQGKSETEFDPDAIVNRAEFVTMLMNTMNRDLVVMTDFSDVQAKDWFYKEVNLAAQVGIVKGNGDGRFDPYSEVTREDLVLMIARLYEIRTGEMLSSPVRAYYDMGKASGYAKDAINGAADAGIITGDENGYFRPKDPATRADALSMIERVVDLIWE